MAAPSRASAPSTPGPRYSNRPRILVVDGDPTIRAALKVALREAGYDVRAEGDASNVSTVAEEYRPDLTILEVCLSAGPNGYQAIRRLRRTSDHPVLFVTSADSLEARLEAFEVGADDYLIKPFSMDELLARVHALLRRSGRLTSEVLQVSDLVIDQHAGTVTRAGTPIELTRTESELLVFMARRVGQALSKTALLQGVWGSTAYNENVVEVAVSSLRRKVEAHGPRIIHTIRQTGYILRVDSGPRGQDPG